MRRVVFSLAAALCAVIGLLSAPPASADIREFNAAVMQQDFRAASIVAAETWPQLDKSSPEIAIVAREFGWVAMLADQPAAAQVYARFLREQGSFLPKPDPSPVVSRVLFEWSNLATAVSADGRARLLSVLQQRAGMAGKDLISIRAAQLLFARSWEVDDWTMAGQAADIALKVMAEVGPEYDPVRYQMRRGRIASDFMRTQSAVSYNAMYDLAEEIYGAASARMDQASRQQLAPDFFDTTAWGDVMYAALRGERRGIPDRSGAVTRGRASTNEMFFPAAGDPALPRCGVNVANSSRQPEYPGGSNAKGFNVVAAYAMTLAPGGRYSDARLLGAAPYGLFANALDKVLPYWRWELDGATPAGTCRMPATQILTIHFQP
jgi:hypothetical protein